MGCSPRSPFLSSTCCGKGCATVYKTCLIQTVLSPRPTFIMQNPRAIRGPSTLVNRTVTPRRPRNVDLREREYLTPKEVDRLQDAARKHSRQASSLPMTASIPARCSTSWGTATSRTWCDTPSCARPLRWVLEGLTYRGPHTRRALRTPTPGTARCLPFRRRRARKRQGKLVGSPRRYQRRLESAQRDLRRIINDLLP